MYAVEGELNKLMFKIYPRDKGVTGKYTAADLEEALAAKEIILSLDLPAAVAFVGAVEHGVRGGGVRRRGAPALPSQPPRSAGSRRFKASSA